jgi:tetratricopeptide (TPR) repeat protein
MTRGDSVGPTPLPQSAKPSTDGRRAELRKLLSAGQPIDVSALLAGHPELAEDKSLLLDLAYEAFCQKHEAGTAVDPEEFCGRFPAYRSSLRRLLGVHQFLEQHPQFLADGRHAPWPQPGQTFLGFSLLRELGRGAFARVFLATEPALGGRPVAVKISRLGATEAQTLGRLDHANIVPVHSVQADPGAGFTLICMPFLGGATLCDLLDRAFAGPGRPEKAKVLQEAIRSATVTDHGVEQALTLSPRACQGTYVDLVLRIGSKLADALAFAHALGICHRDLKPSNVLIAADGRPMLLDFNLSSDDKLTATRMGGTLPYMAPEQLQATDPSRLADATQVDARSDLYSLGIILYELLTGTHPFAPLPATGNREEARTYLVERQRQGALSLRRANPQVDHSLARLVESCLAFAPTERPQSACELAAGLRKGLSWRRRLARWVDRHRPLSAGITAALALLIAWGTYAWFTRVPPGVRQQRLASAAYKQGNYRAAVEHLSRALDDDPGSAALFFARARAYQRMGNLNLAMADYDASDRLAPDGRTTACQGYCYCRLGYNQEAVLVFERARKMGVDSAELFNDLGYSYLQLGKFDDARAALKRAIVLDPRLQAPYYNRAIIYLRTARAGPEGDLKLALADIQQALEIGPPAADLFRHAAALCAVAGLRDRALDFLTQAVKQGQDPQTLGEDFAFRELRNDPWFQELIRTPKPQTPPSKSVRILDPIKDAP